eukprot:3171362-Rhodomonas_salina.3
MDRRSDGPIVLSKHRVGDRECKGCQECIHQTVWRLRDRLENLRLGQERVQKYLEQLEDVQQRLEEKLQVQQLKLQSVCPHLWVLTNTCVLCEYATPLESWMERRDDSLTGERLGGHLDATNAGPTSGRGEDGEAGSRRHRLGRQGRRGRGS